jgi:L-malate glycosyltransferase
VSESALRIVHLDTERGWRGGERQALWLAQELERLGCRSTMAARPGQPLLERSAAAGIETVPCRPRFETDPIAALRLRRYLLASRVDVLHAHTGHAVGLGALATLGTAVQLVASRRVDFRLRRNAVTRWKYGRAAAIVAVSNAVAAVLARGGIDRARIDVVPDGTDTRRVIAPAPRQALAALGVPDGVPLVVQVAQLVGHKDPVNFVRAIATARSRIPSLHALLVGDGPLRAEAERVRESFGLTGAVVLTGYRTDADQLLAAADVVVLSSREEGMGSVLLDALLLGKPIAATTAGGIPEIIEDGISGTLVPPEDSKALGDAIADLLQNPDLASRLSSGARDRAHAFSAESMARRTLAIYERVLSRRSAG